MGERGHAPGDVESTRDVADLVLVPVKRAIAVAPSPETMP
jgi:hypothetical protein